MPLLNEPHCPQCDSTLSLRPLWRVAAGTRFDVLLGKTGIVCPHCGAKLRVTQARVILSVIVLWASWLLGAWLFQLLRHDVRLDPRVFILLVVFFAGGTVALQAFYAPRLARLRLAREGEALYFPLGSEMSSARRPSAASNNRWRGP